MRCSTTTAALAVLLALTASCSQADSAQPRPERPATSTTSTTAAPATAAGITVKPQGGSTVITGPRGERARLPGRFEFDAVSTNSKLLYLIQHLPPRGSENYRVRLYDFAADRLRPEPIADKRNLHTDMSGRPMARTTTDDGVWAFTLYRGAHHVFVHSLNVDRAFSICLDLPHGFGAGSGDWSLELSRDESTLHVAAGSPDVEHEFDLRRELAE